MLKIDQIDIPKTTSNKISTPGDQSLKNSFLIGENLAAKIY